MADKDPARADPREHAATLYRAPDFEYTALQR